MDRQGILKCWVLWYSFTSRFNSYCQFSKLVIPVYITMRNECIFQLLQFLIILDILSLKKSILMGVYWYLPLVLIYISLVIYEVKHFSVCSLAIWISFFF